MSRYYYLVGQLPALSFAGPAPFRWPDFAALCARFLDPGDLDLVASVRLGFPEDARELAAAARRSAVLRDFYAWDASLRNDLARLRAAKLGLEPGRFLRPGRSFPETAAVARASFSAESPFEGETILDRARYDRIEALRTFRYFDLETLVGYGLQLQILLRRSAFDPERGARNFESVRAAVLAPAPDIRLGRRAS